MSESIICHNGAYNLFEDKPPKTLYEQALTKQEVSKALTEKYGDGMLLTPRLDRAHKHGCSSFRLDLEDCIKKAGMESDEFIKRYLTLHENRTGDV